MITLERQDLVGFRTYKVKEGNICYSKEIALIFQQSANDDSKNFPKKFQVSIFGEGSGGKICFDHLEDCIEHIDKQMKNA